MAKLNPILGDLRGKIAGVSFSRNRFGAFARQKITPVDPRSARQMNARSRFATAVIQWRELLSDTQRNNWNTYAEDYADDRCFRQFDNVARLIMVHAGQHTSLARWSVLHHRRAVVWWSGRCAGSRLGRNHQPPL